MLCNPQSPLEQPAHLSYRHLWASNRWSGFGAHLSGVVVRLRVRRQVDIGEEQLPPSSGAGGRDGNGSYQVLSTSWMHGSKLGTWV